MATTSCIHLEVHNVSDLVLFTRPDPADTIFIDDIVASSNFSRQAKRMFFLSGDRSRPWMWRAPETGSRHICIDCLPGSVMPVSVGVTLGSLSFWPHPITINSGSTSVGSLESKGE